jgi:hypothetical protein
MQYVLCYLICDGDNQAIYSVAFVVDIVVQPVQCWMSKWHMA